MCSEYLSDYLVHATLLSDSAKKKREIIKNHFPSFTMSKLYFSWQNYSSVVSLHPEIIEGRPATMVIESFVVDIPEGNTKDETCFFVEALIKCNLKSLADVSERLAVQDRTEPIDRMWLEEAWCDSLSMDETTKVCSDCIRRPWGRLVLPVFQVVLHSPLKNHNW